jgi:hypothetical protein
MLISFDNCQDSLKTYGGQGGRKLGIKYNGENYFLKFPRDIKMDVEFNRSYTNDPLCEYIGSKVYEALDIPVHETLLGTKNGEVVVACKDFRRVGEELREFSAIKVTSEEKSIDSSGNTTDGLGMDFYEILHAIENRPILKKISGVVERFWDMFIVDAWIGNSDRNNGNWGVLSDLYDEFRLAPVYDNGNCLSNRWGDTVMSVALSNPEILIDEAYRDRDSVFEIKGERINPYSYIVENNNPDLLEAIKRNVPKMDMNVVQEILDKTPIITDIQKEYYLRLMTARLDDILKPKLERVLGF